MTHEHKTRNQNDAPRRTSRLIAQPRARHGARAIKAFADTGNRMAFERDAGRVEILGNVGKFRDGRKVLLDFGRVGRGRCGDIATGGGEGPERTLAIAQGENLPGGLLAIKAHRGECIGAGKATQRCHAHACRLLKVAHPPERTMTSNRVDDAMRLLDIKTSNHAQAEADRRL